MFSLPVYRSDLDARWHILPTLCCVFLLYSHRFRLDNPCVFPRITPMSPSMCSIPPGRTRPSTLFIARPCLFCLSIFLTTTDQPSSGHFPSVICWISSSSSASGILFSDLRPLFLCGFFLVSFPSNRRHLTRYYLSYGDSVTIKLA